MSRRTGRDERAGAGGRPLPFLPPRRLDNVPITPRRGLCVETLQQPVNVGRDCGINVDLDM